MTHDPQLVEVLADKLSECLLDNKTGKRDLSTEEIIEDLLDAITASGIVWLAPWEATAGMSAVGIRMTPWPENCGTVYARMRDAHLAEQDRDK